MVKGYRISKTKKVVYVYPQYITEEEIAFLNMFYPDYEKVPRKKTVPVREKQPRFKRVYYKEAVERTVKEIIDRLKNKTGEVKKTKKEIEKIEKDVEDIAKELNNTKRIVAYRNLFEANGINDFDEIAAKHNITVKEEKEAAAAAEEEAAEAEEEEAEAEKE